MNHDGAVELIGDLLQGRLDDPVKRKVLSHMATCKECESLTDTYLAFSDLFSGEAGEPPNHPASAKIVAYALREEELAEPERRQIASHLLTCPTCQMELDATRQGEAELAGSDAPASKPGVGRSTVRVRVYFGAGAAAAVLAAAIGYPLFLGLFEVPRLERRLGALESETTGAAGPTGWAGPVRLLFLRSPVRSSEAEVPTIDLAPGQPYVTLAVDPALADDTRDLRFRIHDPAGNELWSWNVASDRIGHFMGSTGVITFLVPANDLPAGRLTLSVLREAPAGEEHVFDAPFVVSR